MGIIVAQAFGLLPFLLLLCACDVCVHVMYVCMSCMCVHVLCVYMCCQWSNSDTDTDTKEPTFALPWRTNRGCWRISPGHCSAIPVVIPNSVHNKEREEC